jgi:hypothetical protein
MCAILSVVEEDRKTAQSRRLPPNQHHLAAVQYILHILPRSSSGGEHSRAGAKEVQINKREDSPRVDLNLGASLRFLPLAESPGVRRADFTRKLKKQASTGAKCVFRQRQSEPANRIARFTTRSDRLDSA